MYHPNQYFFHLGMPKTASSYLQHALFPNLINVNFKFKHEPIVYQDNYLQEGKSYLFSLNTDKDVHKELELIHSIWPNAKIIFVFREHFDWIYSQYRVYIRKNGSLEFAEFYKRMKMEWGLHPLYYAEIFQKLEELFYGRYLILPYHLLEENPEIFNTKITRFLGQELNIPQVNQFYFSSIESRELKLLRKFNQFFPAGPYSIQNKAISNLIHVIRYYLSKLVSYTGRFIPVKTTDFEIEILKFKKEIRQYYAQDWKHIEQCLSSSKALNRAI